jgi:hypothetical protein
MWFTETPWPPIMIFSAIAAGLAAALVTTQQGRYALGIVALLIASLVTWLVEQNIVTESERVEQAVYDVAEAFQQRDEDRMLSFFSQRTPELRGIALIALRTIEAQDDLRITDVSVDVAHGRADSTFRANGAFNAAGYGNIGHKPTRWDVGWQEEGGDWRIISVEQLDPITGEATDEYLRFLFKQP